ncbi:hypothetical protein [Bradyrhizobium sp. 2S1]|uniref:hypothetical protein n=1 Tax=Bradyrhizobium sp. 2S1 TaxID=1404429 RepID=UPI00140DE8B1|nr:hypothetical protein [Bradyrhizobium sp. 2S1]MCK7672662.1 hypothetical protein [Bradyrhizobium sp. 2S1]MCK7673862.1 hypothetical protein [Bradyrhizobium sp. 2S1]
MRVEGSVVPQAFVELSCSIWRARQATEIARSWQGRTSRQFHKKSNTLLAQLDRILDRFELQAKRCAS